MKSISLMFSLLFLAAGIMAQSPANQPDITVIQKEWRADIRNPALLDSGMSPNDAALQTQSEQSYNSAQNDLRVKEGKPVEYQPPHPASSNSDNQPYYINTTYLYKIKLQNTSSKAIKTITCDYVFFDPQTNLEVGRRELTGSNIDAGKTKTLSARLASPPAGAVTVSQIKNKLRSQYTEKVVVKHIEYRDGTVWSGTK